MNETNEQKFERLLDDLCAAGNQKYFFETHPIRNALRDFVLPFLREEKDSTNSQALLSRSDYDVNMLFEVEEELKKRLMATWEWAHRATQEITGDHRVLFEYPIKSPSLEVYDNLTSLMSELRQLVSNKKKPKP